MRGGKDCALYTLIPLIIPLPAHHGAEGPCSSVLPNQEDGRFTNRVKIRPRGWFRTGIAWVNLRHTLPHHHVPWQLHHPSCQKARADLKGGSYLFTRSTFPRLPLACLLHPVSFYLKPRDRRITYALSEGFLASSPCGTCTLPRVLFLTVLGTGWQG